VTVACAAQPCLRSRATAARAASFPRAWLNQSAAHDQGSVGHTNQIQTIGSLTSTNWQMTQSFLQTNNPQVVSLPLPAGTPKFWRVVAQ